MADLASFLRTHKGRLVEKASRELAHGEGLRLSVEKELERFYDLLANAVESGSAEWLSGLLKEWVESQSAPSEMERQSLASVILALKSASWSVLRDSLAAEDALQMIVALEPVLAAVLQQLIQFETDHLIAKAGQQLVEAQAEMGRLDKSKSKFIGVAAHELKTPLTLIEGYADMLVSELPPEEFPRAQVLLGGVNKGTRRLREIVDDMVDVSLIDNQMLALTFQPVWLRRLFDIAESELGDALRDRHLQYSIVDFDDGGKPIYADPQRLYQVFKNILQNAIKFTPDGGKIAVRARRLPGFVEVTVADTGIGIAPDNQQRIFDKFGGLGNVSLHSSGKVKFKGGGPGLGLAIARGVIEAHGGSIWAESPGYDEKTCPGSTFHVLVPSRESPPADLKPKLFGLTPEETEHMRSLKR